MRGVQRQPRVRLAALLLALGLLTAVAVAPRPAAAQTPDSGCDPEEDVACIPLPEEPAAPATAQAPEPNVAAPLPVRPCLPAPMSVDEGAAIALPQTPIPPTPLPCGTRDVIATINTANALYARALRTWNTADLSLVWRGEALNQIEGYVAVLRSSGHYATPSLRSISLTDLRVASDRARAVTVENWLYQERTRLSGSVVYEENQWVENLYELRRIADRWYVVRNEVRAVSGPPLPPPPVPAPGPLTVTADRSDYAVGEAVTARITNQTGETVTGGGGYRCGFVQVERLGPLGWEPAPGGAEICPLIARLLRPGETAMETVPAGPIPGTYRLLVRGSTESGQTLTASSAPYTVR
jgi:hypothetical protein